MTGEGIGQALLTGRLAAEAIIAAGARPGVAPARATTDDVRHHLVADHRMSVALSQVLRPRRGARGAIRLIAQRRLGPAQLRPLDVRGRAPGRRPHPVALAPQVPARPGAYARRRGDPAAPHRRRSHLRSVWRRRRPARARTRQRRRSRRVSEDDAAPRTCRSSTTASGTAKIVDGRSPSSSNVAQRGRRIGMPSRAARVDAPRHADPGALAMSDRVDAVARRSHR